MNAPRQVVIRFRFKSRNKVVGALVHKLATRLWLLPSMFKWQTIEIQDANGEWHLWRPKHK